MKSGKVGNAGNWEIRKSEKLESGKVSTWERRKMGKWESEKVGNLYNHFFSGRQPELDAALPLARRRARGALHGRVRARGVDE